MDRPTKVMSGFSPSQVQPLSLLDCDLGGFVMLSPFEYDVEVDIDRLCRDVFGGCSSLPHHPPTKRIRTDVTSIYDEKIFAFRIVSDVVVEKSPRVPDSTTLGVDRCCASGSLSQVGAVSSIWLQS